MKNEIPFNVPYLTGNELVYLGEATKNRRFSGDGPFTQKCSEILEDALKAKKVLLTHSCTGALEMAALLLDIQPGDEVIMPSFTFVSTANAFVLRGAVPVFIDIRSDTLNINETLIRQAITKKTKAIVVVHYAGFPCEMDEIMKIAAEEGVFVVEDAAQALGSSYKGTALGSIGHIGALSFHETKNIHCGEGGALIINDDNLIKRAEIIREKGTNRSQFFRGQIDKYTWVDIGSSYLPSELNSAFLYAQLERYEEINELRIKICEKYAEAFMHIPERMFLSMKKNKGDILGNGHLYYIITKSGEIRDAYIAAMKNEGVSVVFHYVPLHSSPYGISNGRCAGSMHNTNRVSDCLVRLPVWGGLGPAEQNHVIEVTTKFFENVQEN